MLHSYLERSGTGPRWEVQNGLQLRDNIVTGHGSGLSCSICPVYTTSRVKQEINSDLVDVLRELGRPTTPRELESRGVRRVRSIGLADVSLLIERAVNRTLMKRTIGGLDDTERRALIEDAEAEFAQLRSELQVLTDSRDLMERHRQSVRSDLSDVKRVLVPPRGFVEQHEAERAAAAKLDAERMTALRLEMQALLLPLFDPGSKPRPGVRRIAEDLLVLFVRDRDRALAEQRRAMDKHVDGLERRIAKLVASLESTERVLAEIAKMKDVELGVASIYRTVQGLAAVGGEVAKKREMLEQIFLSNLEMRGLVHKA